MKGSLLAVPLTFAITLAPGVLIAQQAALESATDSLRSGRMAEAEATLRHELKLHANNPDLMGLLAVVCDQEQKYPEAGTFYARAVALDPNDPALWNNYGNHLIAVGNKRDAEQKFRKVLALEPAHENARIQLAAMALENHQPGEAESYLGRLSAESKAGPRVSLLEMQARYEMGHTADADAIASRLLSGANGDLDLSLAVGAAMSAAGEYEKAESIFSKLAADHPSDPRCAYDLGLVEARLNDNGKALAALTQARSLDPKNTSVLYDLAVVQRKLDQRPAAVETLAYASQMEPARADVQRLLAETLADLGFFADSVTSWNAYLKLQPNDEAARRDCAFAEAATERHVPEALVELKKFASRHPADATGQYELGLVIAATDLPATEAHLNEALRRQPDLAAAHVARGILLYKRGEPASAAADFEAALRTQPKNARTMQHLAQCETAMGKNADALELLEKARALAPDDAALLLALGRVLLKTGDTEQAAQVFKRAREIGPARAADPGAGFLEFVKLPPEQRAARYREGVARAAQQNPSDIEAQVRYLLALENTDPKQRHDLAMHIVDLKPSAETAAAAAGSLLSADDPDVDTARVLIDYGMDKYPADPSLRGLAQAAAQLSSSSSSSGTDGRGHAASYRPELGNGGLLRAPN